MDGIFSVENQEIFTEDELDKIILLVQLENEQLSSNNQTIREKLETLKEACARRQQLIVEKNSLDSQLTDLVNSLNQESEKTDLSCNWKKQKETIIIRDSR